MTRFAVGFLLLASASAAAAEQTDFGIRTVGSIPTAEPARSAASAATWTPVSKGSSSLSGAVRIGTQWGRVTSTYRSPSHNRRVGGVPNSYHLSGRAIDIARKPGVSHAQIAAAYRNAGYHLVESLDEGDHSHFAFSFGGWSPPRRAAPARPERQEVTNWGLVTVAGALIR